MEVDLIIAIGLILGVISAFFLKSIYKQKLDAKTSDFETSNHDELKLYLEALEKEKDTLQKKLLDNEKLLEIVQVSGNNTDNEGFGKLLKEIKGLKDDIEDLEDEISDEKKSKQRIRTEKNDVEEKLDVVTKEKSSLFEENKSLEKELEDVYKKSLEDVESLNFINDILNAQNSSNKDFEKLDRDTWSIYSFIDREIVNCFDYFKEFDCPGVGNIESLSWNWRNSELKTWIKDRKVVAIVGEFSSGKTSIVNRILSQDDPKAPLLPVSSKETTAIPTYVSKSKDFNCQFYSPDGELRNIKKETFENVTKSVLDKVNVSHLVKYFVLSYENKYLDNISILDTPGFASNSDDIIKRTTEVVKEADALFWVIDANMGDINQTSIDVMREHLDDMPLYFILNKSDTKSPGELDALEEKIKQTANNNNIQYKAVIRFSQEENVDVLMEHIQNIETKEQLPLIKNIVDALDDILNYLNKEKEELKEFRTNNAGNLRIIEGNFKVIEEDVIHSVESINSLVKEKETWFGLGNNKFEIDRLDYEDFQNHVSQIVDLSGGIKNQVNYHSEEINTKVEIDSEFSRNNYQLGNVRQIKKDFIKLIKDYNANLLN